MELSRILRFLFLTVCTFLAGGLFLVIAQHITIPIIVWIAPNTETWFYDWGAFGAYRSQSYVSFALRSPQTSVIRWEDSCSDGQVFLNINGPSVADNAPVILDGNGELIWMSNEFPTTMNLKVQRYKGQDYLTFWGGKKAKTSGQGDYFMLDSNYRIAHKLNAVGDGLKADLHEFKINSDDTALFTVYNTTIGDLTPLGMFRGKNSWIVDNIFQEIDIATGELLFQWKASDHFAPEETFMTNPFGGYSETMPFDVFHLNSVEKDSRGNYLVSARHLHTVFYVDGRTGNVLWKFGGRSSDFQDLSLGHASDFKWQHDVRWISEEQGIISLFDNGIAWPHMDAPHSSGRIIHLNTEDFTAQLLHSFTSLQHARSSSQGSLQLLHAADGEPHIFIGWGSSAVYTEHAIDGELLCETHFGARAFWFWERVKSYRAFKSSGWISTPEDWSPNAQIDGDQIYVSWNGATEVSSWELQGTRDYSPTNESIFEAIDGLTKERFEESFELPVNSEYRYFRIAALDDEGAVLRCSNTVTSSFVDRRSYVLAGVAAVSCICVIIGLWFCRRRGLHWPHWRRASVLPTIDRSKYEKLR